MTQIEILEKINSLLGIRLIENDYDKMYYTLRNGNVETLSLKNCKTLDDINFKEFVELIKGLKSVIILRITGSNISDLTPLLELQDLRVLDIIDTPIEDISCLANLSNLRQIHLDRFDTKGVKEIYSKLERCSFFTPKKSYLRKRQ